MRKTEQPSASNRQWKAKTHHFELSYTSQFAFAPFHTRVLSANRKAPPMRNAYAWGMRVQLTSLGLAAFLVADTAAAVQAGDDDDQDEGDERSHRYSQHQRQAVERREDEAHCQPSIYLPVSRSLFRDVLSLLCFWVS